MTPNYETHVNPFARNFVKIRIPDDLIAKACEWSDMMTQAKQSEAHWVKDGGQATKRILTGIMGELALEIYLEKKFIDWSIGDSNVYDYPDLIGIGSRLGIKTVEYGKFPLVRKSSHYPEIINIFHYDNKSCYICGLATVEVLNTYQSDELILSPNLRRRGVKTGFYGFEHLKRIR